MLSGEAHGHASATEFNLTPAGDAIVVTPPMARRNDPRFMAVAQAVRQGDAAFLNLELTFPGDNSYPAAQSRATWIAADPSLSKQLQWVGFNLISAANNHAVDFGIAACRALAEAQPAIRDCHRNQQRCRRQQR